MFVTLYTHRLPADYDMDRIKQRAASRGPDWNSYPGLVFKAFLIREKGKFGAEANAYSSLYLWRDADAAAAMITGERFQSVIDSFGRPSIETFTVLASAFGPAASALFLRRLDELVPQQADLAALKNAETHATAERVRQAEDFAAISALDVGTWRLARFVLSQEAPIPQGQETSYEIAYLARPQK